MHTTVRTDHAEVHQNQRSGTAEIIAAGVSATRDLKRLIMASMYELATDAMGSSKATAMNGQVRNLLKLKEMELKHGQLNFDA